WAAERMTVDNPLVIDLVTVDPLTGIVSLIMVEHREWGEAGELLPDLQAKLNAYFAYVESGQLVQDFPDVAGKPITFLLNHVYELGPREREFIRIAVQQHFVPAGITWRHEMLGRNGVKPN
ncbi:MAG TPA: DUF6572 domain-containing protein, partial [Planctomycetaceae bacterium]|nr:DUF6572 domain-containing protein [Planctomycetaceae bacterium]